MLLLTNATVFMDFTETDAKKVQCYHIILFRA